MQEDVERGIPMAQTLTVTGILATYGSALESERSNRLPQDHVFYERVKKRESAPILSLIEMTERGDLRWRFAPSRTSFYSLGHVAVGTSADGYTLILEQVRDRLSEHFDEYGGECYTHSLTILDSTSSREVFFSTDQGFGWDSTPERIQKMTAKEQLVHRSSEIGKLFALVVGDQNRYKPKRR